MQSHIETDRDRVSMTAQEMKSERKWCKIIISNIQIVEASLDSVILTDGDVKRKSGSRDQDILSETANVRR